LQAELGVLVKSIVEIQDRLEKATGALGMKNSGAEDKAGAGGNNHASDSFWLVLKGENAETGTADSKYFSGEIELKALAPFNAERIKTVKKLLNQIQSVKYLGEFSSEEGIMMSYEIREKLPLIDILKKTLTLERIEKEGANLKLTFN